jgi:hypothetical protein
MARLKEIEYEDIFSPKTMANLKAKSGESRQSLLGDKTLTQTMQKTSALLPEIIQAEEGYTDELEELAIQMMEKQCPIIPFMNIKIDAKIVGMGSMNIQSSSNEVSIDNTPPEAEKAKRRIINGITQGASQILTFSIADWEDWFKQYLNDIDPTLLKTYIEIAKLAFGIYDDEKAIAMLLAMLAAGQKAQGGESEMEYDEEKKQFIIKARAICFPMLIHEIAKGLWEIVGTKGFGPDKEKNQAIVNTVDKISNEPRDMQYGKFIYKAINKIYVDSDVNDPRVRELFFSTLYSRKKGKEFVDFIENAINEELTSEQKKWADTEMKNIEKFIIKKDAENALKQRRDRGL